jgi:hypothetical protein
MHSLGSVLSTIGVLAAIALVVWPVAGLMIINRRREMRCPSCHRPRIHLSRSGVLDRILTWTQAFRCEVCGRLFYLDRSVLAECGALKRAAMSRLG